MTIKYAGELDQFKRACKKERERFVAAIQQQNWNTEMRTVAESLLIMYNQLIEKDWLDIIPDKDIKFHLEQQGYDVEGNEF
jgi:hypothetical protein